MKKTVITLLFGFCVFCWMGMEFQDVELSPWYVCIELGNSDGDRLQDLEIEFLSRGLSKRNYALISQNTYSELIKRGITVHRIESIEGKPDVGYHSYEEVWNLLDSVYRIYPEICRLDTLGYSQRYQRAIPGMKISDNPDMNEDEPSVLYDGLIHPSEPVSMEVCLHLFQYLLNSYDTSNQVKNWINETEIWILPMLNPDGWEYNRVTDLIHPYWYKNMRDNDESGEFEFDKDGVNLNRNFDYNWNKGISTPDHRAYRGPDPFSESETKIKRDLAIQEKFLVSINYHAPAEEAQFAIPADQLGVDLARNLALQIPKLSGSGTYVFKQVQCNLGYSDCWMYVVGGTYEVVVETCPNGVLYPGYEDACQIAEDNVPGALFILEKANVGPGLTGIVTNEAGDPLEASIRILDIYHKFRVTLRTADAEFGRYRWLLLPGTYTLEIGMDGYRTETIDQVVIDSTGWTYLDVVLQHCDDLGQDMETWYEDWDNDGYGNADVHISTCSQPSGFVSNNEDFDDTNPNVVSFALEGDLQGSEQLIKVYPNPFCEKITIRINDTFPDKTGFYIYNLSGKEIYCGELSPGENHIDMYGLPTGLYTISLPETNGRRHSRLIIKE